MLFFHRSALLLVLLTIASCDLFSTRDPEDPGSTTVPVFIQPHSPDAVIQNLKNAVQAMNNDHYLRCLSQEQFVFEPTSDAQSRVPSFWNNWSYEDENIYFRNIRLQVEQRGNHELRLENESVNSIDDDSYQYEAAYTLRINHGDSEIPEIAQGTMILTLTRNESGDWSIQNWRDFSSGSDFSWSDVRYSFY